MLIVSEDAIEEVPVDTQALAIRKNIAQVESALTEFDRISAGLDDLAERYPPDLVYDVSTTKGMQEAVAHRAAWRDPRINVEKYRKTAKAPVLALGKDIDARAAWLDEQLRAGEAPVDQQIKAHEARKEAEKQAKINAEFGRVQAIQEAIADIHMRAMAVVGKPSEQIKTVLDAMLSEPLDPLVYQEQMAQATAARDASIGKLEQALRAQLFTESEAAKVAAERAELEQLRREAAVQRAKDEAAMAEAARVERERAAAEQQRLDAEAAAKRAAEDAAAAEARRVAQIEHDAKMKTEREAIEAERAAAEAKARKEAAARRKAEAADKKLRDAAPVMLAALRLVRDIAADRLDDEIIAVIDPAINAAV